MTLLCFYLVFNRTEAIAAREGLTVAEYLLRFFQDVLGGLVNGDDPLFAVFLCVDSHASWRAIRWFNAPQLRLVQVLPIRASAYILSLVNEQVGKGVASLISPGATTYLDGRHCPLW